MCVIIHTILFIVKFKCVFVCKYFDAFTNWQKEKPAIVGNSGLALGYSSKSGGASPIKT